MKKLSARSKSLIIYGIMYGILLFLTDTLEEASLLFIGFMSLVYLKSKICSKRRPAGGCPPGCGGCN